MIFTGTYEHAIDSKNRLAVPSEVRVQLQRAAKAGEGDPLPLYVTLGEGGVLCIYTREGFEKRADELDHSELNADELLAYERLLFSLSQRVEIDKQGRIRLPESLLKRVKLGPEVTLIGVKDHLEVHDRAKWQEYVESILSNQPALLMNPRRAMRKGGE